MAMSKEAKTWVATIALTVAAMSSAPWWWHYMPWSASGPPEGVVGFSGGCDAFQVFAQNRWDPVGASVRAQPNINSKVMSTYSANHTISVNGWVHSRPAYPTNTAPWNSDVWYHVADDSGWISFPGVRATPVSHDPTGQAPDGGPPAPTSKKCQGATQ